MFSVGDLVVTDILGLNHVGVLILTIGKSFIFCFRSEEDGWDLDSRIPYVPDYFPYNDLKGWAVTPSELSLPHKRAVEKFLADNPLYTGKVPQT